jgi:para-aminobenzoate synthetase component 1
MRPLDPGLAPETAFAALRRPGAPSIFFDGRGGHDGAWPCRLAIDPRLTPVDTIRDVDRLVARRRAAGGPGGTGVALLASYEGGLTAFEIDALIAFPDGRPAMAIGRGDLVLRAETALSRRPSPAPEGSTLVSGRPRTSLPREAYLRAVLRVKDYIADGDLYQANLTQRFEAPFDADPWDLYRAIGEATPAPRSAYVEAPGLALASMSPEIFVDVSAAGAAETRPIKGTRPRGGTAGADAEAARELLASTKDRAELVMIVDVLRNDLGRVSRIGSVSVPELLALRSYPAVHHLVARVQSSLRPGVTFAELFAAVFPGGSITGAPKERAIQRLSAIETCPRGLYTGSLFWLDDDGSIASSILIRSAFVANGRVHVGAGGGIVADSDPEAEWSEANAKARALTRALGFEPEEAA